MASTLDALEKEAELRSEAAQLDVAIQVAEKELTEDNRQIARLHDAIVTAKQSPYYLSATGQPLLNFAFVPYDNQASATPGSPVYDCYLNMILCRKVGVVVQRFPGEEQILHPIFKNQIRGFLIQMNLSHEESAKSKTVFLGGKPLFFLMENSMAVKVRLAWLLAFSSFAVSVCAQSPHDADTFCAYQMEQAEAQRDFLRTPTAQSGLTQPETGLPTQIVGGATLGVSNVKKAAITMYVAHRNCDLYRSTTSVQQQLQYAIPALTAPKPCAIVLLLSIALPAQLQALMDSTQKMLNEQNATRLMVFTLESTRTKLEADRADTQSKIAAIIRFEHHAAQRDGQPQAG